MAHERMKSHSNVDDDVCVDCCVVLHTLNAKPTTSATAAAAVAAEKKSGFYFSMHNTATAAAVVSDTGYNFNTLSYLLGFESVRKPNETNERTR